MTHPRSEADTDPACGHPGGALGRSGSARLSGDHQDHGDTDGKEHGRAKSDTGRGIGTAGANMSAARGSPWSQPEPTVRKARSGAEVTGKHGVLPAYPVLAPLPGIELG